MSIVSAWSSMPPTAAPICSLKEGKWHRSVASTTPSSETNMPATIFLMTLPPTSGVDAAGSEQVARRERERAAVGRRARERVVPPPREPPAAVDAREAVVIHAVRRGPLLAAAFATQLR